MSTDRDKINRILIRNGYVFGTLTREECERDPDLFQDLYEYFLPEMPYGVAKARTGMPDEWVFNRLVQLGFAED